MNKYGVALSFLAAVLVANSSLAQDASGTPSKTGPQSIVGSDTKTPTPSGADASKPESKLGLTTKPKAKGQPGFDNANPGPYGAGLKKVPKKKPAAAPSPDAATK